MKRYAKILACLLLLLIMPFLARADGNILSGIILLYSSATAVVFAFLTIPAIVLYNAFQNALWRIVVWLLSACNLAIGIVFTIALAKEFSDPSYTTYKLVYFAIVISIIQILLGVWGIYVVNRKKHA